jgi:hypothetical protein
VYLSRRDSAEEGDEEGHKLGVHIYAIRTGCRQAGSFTVFLEFAVYVLLETRAYVTPPESESVGMRVVSERVRTGRHNSRSAGPLGRGLEVVSCLLPTVCIFGAWWNVAASLMPSGSAWIALMSDGICGGRNAYSDVSAPRRER